VGATAFTGIVPELVIVQGTVKTLAGAALPMVMIKFVAVLEALLAIVA
jgi:hypothetical protein